jgi:hypothetical protein
MNKKIIVAFFIFVAVLSIGSLLLAQGKSMEYKGILSDVACRTKGTAGDGTDMKMNPEKHTVACMKMPGCMKSGYGLIMKDTADKLTFYEFDAARNKLAADLLNKTTKTDNMMITVMGTMVDGKLKIESLVETQ